MSKGPIGNIVIAWHRDTFDRDNRATRTSRIRLSRCNSPLEALLHGETHELNRRLKEHDVQANAGQLLALTSVMSRIHDVQISISLAALFGSKPAEDAPPRLSEARFRSVVGSRSLFELAPRLVRFLDVLGPRPRCNGYRLAEDIYTWNDGVRDAWCLQYHGIDPSRSQTWEFPQ